MNRRVKTAAGEDKRVGSDRDIQRDIRIPALKIPQSGNEPAAGKGRRRGDFQASAAVRSPHQILRISLKTLQRLADMVRIARAVGVQPHPAPRPLKQLAV